MPKNQRTKAAAAALAAASAALASVSAAVAAAATAAAALYLVCKKNYKYVKYKLLWHKHVCIIISCH